MAHAVSTFVHWVLEGLVLAGKEHTAAAGDGEVPLCIYSCHNFSMIGLMCALFAARSADTTGADAETNVGGYYVRFSLNGNVLQLSWGVG